MGHVPVPQGRAGRQARWWPAPRSAGARRTSRRRSTTWMATPTGSTPTSPAGRGTRANWYVEDLGPGQRGRRDACKAGLDAGSRASRTPSASTTIPSRSRMRAEGFPMIAAFGAFQGWGAIYSFDYRAAITSSPTKLDGFFDIKSDPSRLVHMPACAAMFLRGDVAPRGRRCWLPSPRGGTPPAPRFPECLDTDHGSVRSGRRVVAAPCDRAGPQGEKSDRAGQAVVLEQDLPLRHGATSLGCLAAGGRLFHGGYAPHQALHRVHPRPHVSAWQCRPRDRFDPAGLGDGHDDGHRG